MNWWAQVPMRTRIASGFFLLSGLWILLVDIFLEHIFHKGQTLEDVQFWEELFYVALASIVIYWILSKYFPTSDRLPTRINSRRFLDGLTEGILIHNMDGKVIDCNETAERILSLTREEILTTLNHTKTCKLGAVNRSGRHLEFGECPFMVSAKTGEPVIGKVMGLDKPDGTRQWLLVSTHPIRENGKLVAISASLIDATIRQNALQDLEEAYNETLTGLAAALDIRDHSTGEHTKRVADLTVALAKEYGISNGELESIYRGSILHDIGKMGVPDSILSKPGKLTDDEWVAMRRHPEIAVDMLKDVHFLQTAMNIPHYHHERWNGTGYPQGLAGTDIPLSARLFSIVDVYDALTNVRPYRGPMPTAEALRYIQSQSGTHFDPDVVAAFLRMMHAQSEKVLLQKIV